MIAKAGRKDINIMTTGNDSLCEVLNFGKAQHIIEVEGYLHSIVSSITVHQFAVVAPVCEIRI